MAKNIVEEMENNYREVKADETEDTIKVELVKEKKGLIQRYKELPLWAKILVPVGGVALVGAGGFVIYHVVKKPEVAVEAVAAVAEQVPEAVVENVVTF